MGAFITLEEPMRDMNTEAVSSGFYESGFFKGTHFPKLQIITIADIFAGRKISYPQTVSAKHQFKKAEGRDKVDQLDLS